jgi:hypothetical protein
MIRQKARDRRAERLRIRRRPLAPLLRKYQSRELDPILEILHKKEYCENIKKPLRKFLVIISVSIAEDFLMRLLAKTIDDNHADISIFGSDKARSFSPGKLSKGQHIAREYNFASPDVIDNTFSKLLKTNDRFNALKMNFLDAVKKADWYDPVIEYKEYTTKHLHKNWNNFLDMFEKRNKLVHGMSQIRLSNSMVATFCDNIVTFLDTAISVCLMDESTFDILESESKINSGRKPNSLAEASFHL